MTYSVVFPGQGSQSVGMLADLASAFPVVASTFAESADVLGNDLWALAQSGPASELSDTRVTQPLMFTADIAVWRCLQQSGLPLPVAVAGHSLGEFAALVAVGSLSFTDGLKLVAKRAQLMAAAVPDGEGGMAALIGMDDDAVVELCQSISGDRVSEAVNFNAPGQVAISGHLDAIEKTCELAREKGARKAMMLPVSVPNHSSLMRDAGEQLAQEIAATNFSEPSVPVIQNASASALPSLDELVASLEEHVYSPVQWTRTIQTLINDFGVDTIIESGPGKVLTGLGKRIDRSVPTLPTETPESIRAAIDAVTATIEEA